MMSDAGTDERMGAGDVTCRYSAAHAMAGVPAVTVIHCGPVGDVPACQKCAEFYRRMGGES